MDFIYSFIDKLDVDVDVDINVDSVYNHLNKQFNIVCYHIDITGKYPFLQFLLVYHNNMFTFPKSVDIRDTLTKMKLILDIQGTLIKGLYQNEYLFIHIPNISIPNISIPNISNLIDTISIQFVLPTEIINNQSVYNIPIDENVVSLFTNDIEISLLTRVGHKNKYYNLPDAVYTSDSTLKASEFKLVFGNNKTTYDSNHGSYYCFYRGFNDLPESDEYINRYAVFIEGDIDELTNITNETINKLPNLFIKDFNNIISLSKYKK